MRCGTMYDIDEMKAMEEAVVAHFKKVFRVLTDETVIDNKKFPDSKSRRDSNPQPLTTAVATFPVSYYELEGQVTK
jgi:hypothetical protein